MISSNSHLKLTKDFVDKAYSLFTDFKLGKEPEPLINEYTVDLKDIYKTCERTQQLYTKETVKIFTSNSSWKRKLIRWNNILNEYREKIFSLEEGKLINSKLIFFFNTEKSVKEKLKESSIDAKIISKFLILAKKYSSMGFEELSMMDIAFQLLNEKELKPFFQTKHFIRKNGQEGFLINQIMFVNCDAHFQIRISYDDFKIGMISKNPFYINEHGKEEYYSEREVEIFKYADGMLIPGKLLDVDSWRFLDERTELMSLAHKVIKKSQKGEKLFVIPTNGKKAYLDVEKYHEMKKDVQV